MKNKSRSTQPFRIKYKENYAPYELEKHYHNSYEIVFIVEGESKFEISGKEYYAKKNSILFINNFEFHKTTVIKYPYKRYFLLISQDYLRSFVADPVLLSILIQRPQSFKHLIDLDSEISKDILDFIKIISKEYLDDKSLSIDAIGNYLNLILIQLFRNYPAWFPYKKSNSSLDMINEIQKHIEANYNDYLTLKETAELFNIDMYYLSHLFKEVTGFSFKEYLILQRISKAKDLLIYTNKNVTEICISSGFNNVNHFIRTFKKKEKLTPLQFRKNNTK